MTIVCEIWGHKPKKVSDFEHEGKTYDVLLCMNPGCKRVQNVPHKDTAEVIADEV